MYVPAVFSFSENFFAELMHSEQIHCFLLPSMQECAVSYSRIQNRQPMDFELWYLVLIPILFAAGWWARGHSVREELIHSRTIPEAYSRGVTLLMSEHPDKAIDSFIEVVRLDPELIELHHVLGTLFRRRGEFERAIKLHNHLVNREDIPEKDRVKALRELGEDYLRAGLFDRAEATYRRLLENPSEHLDALRALLTIYCTEHEWTAAIDVARQLEARGGEDRAQEISHYYCELAETAVRRKNLELADEHVRNAVMKCPTSVRANVLAGAVSAALGERERALAIWTDVMEQHPDYLPLVVGKIADAMLDAGEKNEAIALLHHALAESSGIDVMEECINRIAALEGNAVAASSVVGILSEHPSLSAFSTLIALRLKENPGDQQTKLLSTLLQRHSRRLARYQCAKCGFLASNFSWHCLGCGAWDSFPPRRLEDAKPRH